MNSEIDYTLDPSAGSGQALESGLTQVLDDGQSAYLYGPSTGSGQAAGRLAQDTGSGMQYYLTDALGSVRQVVDENDAILLSEGYQPYGEMLEQAGDGASVFGFAGEARDNTGLTYLRARYYEPGTGRFTQIDPSRLERNLYQYASGNPVNRVDPSGYFAGQNGNPLTGDLPCTVQPGDTLTGIAYGYGYRGEAVLDSMADLIASTNGLANEDLIYPGQRLFIPKLYEEGYHCDPNAGAGTPPPAPGGGGGGPYQSGEITGYIEGTSENLTLGFAIITTKGTEAVYDFMTGERAQFTYEGNYVINKGALCGLSTQIFNLGKSWYAGYFHFPPEGEMSLEQAYGGTALSLAVGVGSNLNPLEGILGAFDLGMEITAFASANGQPIFNVPTISDISLHGVTVTYLSEAGSYGASGRLPFSISLTNVQYWIDDPNTLADVSYEQMASEIRSGALSDFMEMGGGSVLPVVREWFAGILDGMYAP